jgi:DNA/RNA endonuclease G (NUC1)
MDNTFTFTGYPSKECQPLQVRTSVGSPLGSLGCDHCPNIFNMADSGNIAPYDPHFLGEKVTLAADWAPNDPETQQWLYHCHFNNLFDKTTRVTICSVANVDLSKDLNLKARNYGYDPQVDASSQYGVEWYNGGEQEKWDQGHMTLRDTIGWGTKEEAKQATTHVNYWTNITPQRSEYHHDLWGPVIEAAFRKIIQGAKNQRGVELTGALFLEAGKLDEKVKPGYKIPVENVDTKSDGSEETRRVPNSNWKGVYWVDAKEDTLHCCFWIAYQDVDPRNNAWRLSSHQEIFGLLGFTDKLKDTQWSQAQETPPPSI